MNLLHISQILQEQCQINPGDRLAVAVSGGSDSVALLHLLTTLGYPVVALHLNHQIRQESTSDADFVRVLCAQWNIRCEMKSMDVPRYAQTNHLSIEEAARILRYRFLFSVAKMVDASALVTAHHGNDQAETVLMHFIRGSGLDGLKGMAYRTLLSEFDPSIPLVRPLLDVKKQDLLEYCRLHQIPFVEDATNRDPSYFRNWLRLTLMPQIESFNPQFQHVLLNSIETLRADSKILDKLVDSTWEGLQVSEGNGYLSFPLSSFRDLDLGLQYRVIRKAIRRLKMDNRDINLAMVRRVIDFLDHPTQSNHQDLGLGLRMFFEENRLFLVVHAAEIPVLDYPQLFESINLTLPWQIRFKNGWVCSSELIQMSAVSFETIQSAGKWDAWMDLDQIQQPLNLVTRSAGDRFSPLGGKKHTIKISDLFINHKIPAYARDHYPLIKDSKNIIWVPGIQISEYARVTSGTQRILRIRMIKDNPGQSLP